MKPAFSTKLRKTATCSLLLGAIVVPAAVAAPQGKGGGKPVELDLGEVQASVGSGNPVTRNDDAAKAAKLRRQMEQYLDRVGKNTKNQPLVTRKDGSLSQVVPVDQLNYSVARINRDGSVTVRHAGSLDELEQALATDASTQQPAEK